MMVSIAQAVEQIDFFYSETCPHCKAEMSFLKNLEAECTHIKINYHIAKDETELLNVFADRYNTTPFAVPRTFIGDRAFIGFSEEKGQLEFNDVYKAYIGYSNVLEDEINQLTGISDHSVGEKNCTSPQENVGNIEKNKNSWIFLIIIAYGLLYIFLQKKIGKDKKKLWLAGFLLVIIISLFIFFTTQSEVSIKNFAQNLPFPFFVTIIALADGFNPCAFTVLIILLSLLTYTKNKKHMGVIGFTFIVTSAIMYFIFIMAMILVGSWALEKYGGTILMLLGSGIMIAGLVNIKDFFFFQKGVSLTMSKKEKMTVTKKARNIVNMLKESNSKKTFLLALGATVLLSIFVNLVELGCTAILPAVYMTSLIKSFGSSIGIPHVIWSAYYSILYVLPLLGIMLVFIFTFKSTRINEKQGRILKLVSGLFMLLFGILMVFFPEILVFG